MDIEEDSGLGGQALYYRWISAFVRKTNAAQCEEMLNIFLGHFWEGGGVGEDSLAPFL